MAVRTGQAAVRRRGQLLVAAALALVLLGTVLASLDASRALRLLEGARPGLLGVALVTTGLAFLGNAASIATASRAFGVKVPMAPLVAVGFLSTTLNNVVSMAGAAGFSLRYTLLARRNVPNHVIAASIVVHSYLSFVVFATYYPTALAYVVVTGVFDPQVTRFVLVGGLAFMGLVVAGAWIIAARRPRRWILGLVASLARRFRRAPDFGPFDATVAEGVAAFRSKPARLVPTLAFLALEWWSAVATLMFCFLALDTPVPLGVLVTAFALGVTLGILSMLPGGIGVQDASMAGTLHALGVPLEESVVGAGLFRVIYYLVPFLVSLPLYRGALAEHRATTDP